MSVSRFAAMHELDEGLRVAVEQAKPLRLVEPAPEFETLIVTFWAGPGTGKSTTAAAVFAELKQRGHNVELAHEFAKELTWEERFGALSCQPYVAGKQIWRRERLKGKVDAILTDTSPLLGLIYGDEDGGATPAFREWLLDDYRRQNSLDFFLVRDPRRVYNAKGRNQTKSEAEALDHKIARMLKDYLIPYTECFVDQQDNTHVSNIVSIIEGKLCRPS